MRLQKGGVGQVLLAIFVIYIAIKMMFGKTDKPEPVKKQPTAQELKLAEGLAKEKLAKVKHTTAFFTCSDAIKRTSIDPKTVKVPFVGYMLEGVDWRYLWATNTDVVRMRNGLGLEVAVQAFCVVDENTGYIKLLTVDGEKIIAPS